MIRDRLARQSRRGLRDLGRIAHCAFRDGGGAMRAHLLTTTAAVALLAAMPARAQDATWSTTPGSSDFNTAGNWTPATVPTGTAMFGASTLTALTFISGAVNSLRGFTFYAGAPAAGLFVHSCPSEQSDIHRRRHRQQFLKRAELFRAYQFAFGVHQQQHGGQCD